MKYYLGIDGGGTSTNFAIYDDFGVCLDTLKLDSIHFMKVDDTTMRNRLVTAKDYFINYFNDGVVNVAFGLAGYGSNKDTQSRIENVIYSIFPNAYITNDAKFAMISRLDNKDGVYLISGTGSIAFKLKEGLESRRGGYGYLVGDEGSGFWTGKRLLERFTQETDGRKPKTEIYDKIMKSCNLEDAYDIVNLAVSKGVNYREWVASFCELLSDVESAQKIFYQSGVELSKLANSFDIDEKTLIALGGSVLENQKSVKEGLLDNLNENFVLVENNNRIEYSAYLLFKSL